MWNIYLNFNAMHQTTQQWQRISQKRKSQNFLHNDMNLKKPENKNRNQTDEISFSLVFIHFLDNEHIEWVDCVRNNEFDRRVIAYKSVLLFCTKSFLIAWPVSTLEIPLDEQQAPKRNECI